MPPFHKGREPVRGGHTVGAAPGDRFFPCGQSGEFRSHDPLPGATRTVQWNGSYPEAGPTHCPPIRSITGLDAAKQPTQDGFREKIIAGIT